MLLSIAEGDGFIGVLGYLVFVLGLLVCRSPVLHGHLPLGTLAANHPHGVVGACPLFGL